MAKIAHLYLSFIDFCNYLHLNTLLNVIFILRNLKMFALIYYLYLNSFTIDDAVWHHGGNEQEAGGAKSHYGSYLSYELV